LPAGLARPGPALARGGAPAVRHTR